jgi:hypothetical protein
MDRKPIPIDKELLIGYMTRVHDQMCEDKLKGLEFEKTQYYTDYEKFILSLAGTKWEKVAVDCIRYKCELFRKEYLIRKKVNQELSKLIGHQ